MARVEQPNELEGITGQREALRQAREAAAAGDPLGMLAHLYSAKILDGLVRRIGRRWPTLTDTEVEFAVAGAADVLLSYARTGRPILDVGAFLWRVSDRMADKTFRSRVRATSTEPSELEKLPDPSADATTESVDGAEEGDSWRDGPGRQEAIAKARALLPRIGQRNVQAVMEVILEAIQAGREDLTSREIGEITGLDPNTVRTLKARGFARLKRIAVEEGLADRSFTLPMDDEEPEDDETRENGGT